MKRTALGGLSVFAIACFGLVACSSKTTGSDSTNGDSAEASASNAQSTHIGNIVIEGVQSQDPTQAAASASVGGGQLWPQGCATRAKDATDPKVAHITLNDCTGPFGLAHFSGQITVTFSPNADGSLHAAWASNNLTINGRPVTYSASADITITGTTRSVAWNSAWTRSTAGGETISHTASLQIVVDAAAHCRTANGTAQTNVGGREVDSTIKDYKLCYVGGLEGCPSGTITHLHKATNRTVTVTFDGTSEATITGPNGGTVQEPLVCGA